MLTLPPTVRVFVAVAPLCVFRADPGAHSDGTRGLIPR
jgi:hypothetical protein